MVTVRSLESVHSPRYLMYYIYGQSGPSLLIESTDSMIQPFMITNNMHCLHTE